MSTMSTSQTSHVAQSIIKELIAELEKLVDTAGNVKRNDIVGSFQNVVMIDFGMKVDDLPEGLQDLYNRSRIDPMRRQSFEILRRHLNHMSREV